MSPAPRLLDADVLQRFEVLLRERCVGVVEAWAPGLTDAEIDEIIGPTNLQLPEEVRAWWRWHDGLADGHPPHHWEIVPGRVLLNLQTAVNTYQYVVAEYVGAQDGLLMPVGEKPLIYVACRENGTVPAPVYYERRDHEPEVTWPSFGEFVLTCIDYIESGVFAADPDGGWAAPRVDAAP